MGAELGVTIATTLDATTMFPKPTFRSFGVILYPLRESKARTV
jgi:hypothetical protein